MPSRCSFYYGGADTSVQCPRSASRRVGLIIDKQPPQSWHALCPEHADEFVGAASHLALDGFGVIDHPEGVD